MEAGAGVLMIQRIQLEQEKKLRGTRANQSLWFLNREKFLLMRDSLLLHSSHHLNAPGGTDIKGIDFPSSFSWFFLWTLSEDSKMFLSYNQDTYKLYLSGGIYLELHICSPTFIILSLTVLSHFKWLSFL